MGKSIVVIGLVLATATTLWAAETYEARDVVAFTDTGIGLTVVGGVVDLPRDGVWRADPTRGKVLDQAVIVTAPVGGQARRLQSAARDRTLDQGRWVFERLFQVCARYAQQHDGVGPQSLSDLEARDPQGYKSFIDSFPSYGQDGNLAVFLLSQVPIPMSLGQGKPSPMNPQTAVPLALELRPLVDDGFHWVVMNNGVVQRRPIDPELARKYGLTIEPARKQVPLRDSDEATAFRNYAVYAVCRDAKAGRGEVRVEDATGKRTAVVVLDPSVAKAGGHEALSRWADLRASSWQPFLGGEDAPLLRRWVAAGSMLYGSHVTAVQEVRPRQGQFESIFGVLGGRAAVRETLQLQALTPAAPPAGADVPVPVSQIKGVDVPSHPFDSMLGDRAGGRLDLADLCPPDRLFVYFAKPAALLAFLEEGAEFIFDAGSSYLGRSVAYDLKDRYFGKMGVSAGWIAKFLKSGEVQDLALIVPDLFFIDGTEVTVAARVPRIDRVAPLLKALGILDLREDEVTVVRGAAKNDSFWTRRGKIVLASTFRPELERVLSLLDRRGEGSLGKSAEFRFMLEKMPVRAETRLLAYLSDPFIRRMVGPEVKIGQYRRIVARGTLEALTAGSLLRRLDSGRSAESLEYMARVGYVPAAALAEGYTLGSDGVAESPVYGRASDMKGLLRAPVETASAREVAAYGRYLEAYNRFWRRYFDPIAVRLDDGPKGGLELTTYVLPLVENSLYSTLREVVASEKEDVHLRVPVLGKEPVLSLSFNLTEKSWSRLAQRLSSFVGHYTGLDQRILDLLGPGLTVAVMDSDPVIAVGSGDVMGALGGRFLGRGELGFTIPLLLTVLTRPSQVIVELNDEKACLEILRRSALALRPQNGQEQSFSLRQTDGKDSWIGAYDLMGVLSIRFGIEVRDGFLVLSNLPWANSARIKKADIQPLGGASLSVNTAAVAKQLPALFVSAKELEQRSSLQGMAYLYPLLLATGRNPEQAAALNMDLFGFRPLHPSEGKWTFEDGILKSTVYGSAERWRIPEHREGDRSFGLLAGVEDLEANMQFEDDGLRASVRWVWKKP